MNSSTKITLRSQTGRGSKYSLQKLNLVYQIGLKLALINGYDEEFRIRNKNGEIVPNANLLDLIHNSMTVNKNLVGMEEYVQLLAETNANPDWFVNHNVKSSLTSLLAKKSSPRPQTLDLTEKTSSEPIEQPPQVINPITTGAYWGPEKANEKKRILATYRKPPPLKKAPISYTPPTSPPSPFLRDDPFADQDVPPILDRMDGPPSSPPLEMPNLKRKRTENIFEETRPDKKNKADDIKELVNKSMAWDLPDEDTDFD